MLVEYFHTMEESKEKLEENDHKNNGNYNLHLHATWTIGTGDRYKTTRTWERGKFL